ncbi:MAG: aminoacyl-tRNA hydrolase [Claussenomyces sp. TS43310]|nr:MAG: aminoacyl-tRNA hydrolase [Claussenomyces sp. TS43310]
MTFTSSNLSPPLTTLPSMSPPMRLLVCSIGNPGAYLNTLHSAGHTILTRLAQSLSYPPFERSRSHANGLLSSPGGGDHGVTLWQSPTLMNVSGPAVAAAWRQFLRDGPGDTSSSPPARLVVVHDELESALGDVRIKRGDASPKGHNGLKSIREQMRALDYTRIAVGIGRPSSRDPDVVAAYVLRKMTPAERLKIEGAAARVEVELRRLAEDLGG